MKAEKAILKCLRYFLFFNYSPFKEELFYFSQYKFSSFKKFENVLSNLIEKKEIFRKNNKYTLRGHSIINSNNIDATALSIKKIKKIFFILKKISYFSAIKMIGVSGSLAMLNAKKNDDIDIFIIAKKNRIWSARFICLFLAEIFGKRRVYKEKDPKDKLCFNLFFSEENLIINPDKRNYYVAHEVVQMKPYFIKKDIYKKFLNANNWVFYYFPNLNIDKLLKQNIFYRKNVELISSKKKTKSILFIKKMGDFFEFILKSVQLNIMKNKISKEIITNSQLWFIPNDFQNKLKKFL